VFPEEAPVTATRDVIEQKLGRVEFTLMLSLTMALGALAIDMILPAMGELRESFGLDPDSNATAAIISFFLLGLAFGQIVWGPLADVVGRKRILYIGLTIYVIGSIASSLSPTLSFLLASRFVWGIGAAGSQVVARSVIRDTYEGEAMARAMSFIMAVFLLVPIIAPSLGALILQVGPWQWIFLFTAVYAVGIAVWTMRLPETLAEADRIPFNVGRLSQAGKFVVSNRMTMGFTLAQATVFGFFASYLASSQLILDDIFGVGDWFPVFFGLLAVVMGIVMLVNTRLLKRMALRPLLRRSFTLYLVATAVFGLAMVATGGHPPFALFVLLFLPILFAHALLIPNLNAIAMIPMGSVAGTAAAIVGTVATLGGSVIGMTIDRAYNGSLVPFGIAAAITGIIAFGLSLWADRNYERSVDDVGNGTSPATAPSMQADSEHGEPST
jgi:DHA1 family bicyclomycin/chloramphenicol resistance-like MFS transporter